MPVFLLALGWVKSAVSAIGLWLSHRSFMEIICIGLAIVALSEFASLRAERRHSAKLSAALVKCDKARAADRTAYEQAQKDAAAKNKADVAAKEAQSQRISDNAKTAYARDLAELRRLRSRTAKGAAGPAHPSESRPAPGGADADGLQLSADEHLQASEIELRLMHLQNWVIEQLQAQ